MDRTEWTDRRIDDLARRINGMPESIATLVVQLSELRSDVAEMNKEVGSLKGIVERRSAARESNQTSKLVAFVTAGAAVLAAAISSVALLVNNV